MKSYLAFFLALAALWESAAAHGDGDGHADGDDHGHSGTGSGSQPAAAASVSVANFKSYFTTAQIVPDVLAAFNPSVAFYAGFNTGAGAKALLTPGMSLSKTGKYRGYDGAEALRPFELSVEGIANMPNVTASTRYLVYMIGPDVPTRATPTSRNVRHYLAGNLTVQNGATSSVLKTAMVLRNSTPATNEYNAPSPAAGTGVHRYVWLLYVQPPQFNSRGFETARGFNASARQGFNLAQFHAQAGLGPAIGGTYFTIDGDGNGSASGTASGTRPGPTGPVAAAAASLGGLPGVLAGAVASFLALLLAV